MTEDFLQAKNLIENSQNILFTTHEKTDGDDFGSVSAIALHCQNQGKNITISTAGGFPSQLNFLALASQTQDDVKEGDYDLLVISGCSNIERIRNPFIETLNIPKINFDHHPDNQMYGDVNVVDPNKSSVAELVYDFFKFCNWQITPKIAQSLLTGIVTDTGIFMHSNTGATTLEAAANLLENGAILNEITKSTYENKSALSMQAWAKALQNSYLNKSTGVIYSILTEKDLEELGNPELTIFEGVVETLNKAPEAKYAMFLKEEKGRIKGSLRSDPHKGTNVQEIAQKLGGGGHKWASGFSLYGKLEKSADGNWQIISTKNS